MNTPTPKPTAKDVAMFQIMRSIKENHAVKLYPEEAQWVLTEITALHAENKALREALAGLLEAKGGDVTAWKDKWDQAEETLSRSPDEGGKP